jgi:hypothetical protein
MKIQLRETLCPLWLAFDFEAGLVLGWLGGLSLLAAGFHPAIEWPKYAVVNDF